MGRAMGRSCQKVSFACPYLEHGVSEAAELLMQQAGLDPRLELQPHHFGSHQLQQAAD